MIFNQVKKHNNQPVFILLLFITYLGSTTILHAQSMTRLLGDVNYDDRVNIVDALMIARSSIGINVPGIFLTSADVNCDQKINIVDSLIVARYSIGILPSLCKPTIGWKGSIYLSPDPLRQVFIDLNGDKLPDMLHLSTAGGGIVYLNNGAGGFSDEPEWSGLYQTGSDPLRQKFVDMNNDGIADWVHINNAGGSDVYLNDGMGNFADSPVWSGLVQNGNNPEQQVFIDFNNDNLSDWLHISSAGGGVLYLNSGSGGFQPSPAWTGLTELGPDPSRQKWADVNGDDYTDWLHISSTGGTIVYYNNKNSGFISQPGWEGLAILGSDSSRQFFTDIDNNGTTDWLHVSTAGGVAVYNGDTNGGFRTTAGFTGLYEIGEDPSGQQLADTDGDGYPDWIHISSTGGAVVFLNDNTGGFHEEPVWAGLAFLGNDPGRQIFTDMDGDLTADWIHISTTGSINIYMSDNHGGFYSFF